MNFAGANIQIILIQNTLLDYKKNKVKKHPDDTL